MFTIHAYNLEKRVLEGWECGGDKGQVREGARQNMY